LVRSESWIMSMADGSWLMAHGGWTAHRPYAISH
jgi:hypothetical protein